MKNRCIFTFCSLFLFLISINNILALDGPDNIDYEQSFAEYNDILERVSKGSGYTSDLPAISAKSLKEGLIALSFDRPKFLEFLYLKILVGIELKTLLSNLAEVSLFKKDDDSEFLDDLYQRVAHLLKDFPEIDGEFTHLIERESKSVKESPLTYKTAIIKLEDMLRAHFQTLSDLDKSEEGAKELSASERKTAVEAISEHREVLQNKLPIANFDSIRDYFEDNPDVITAVGKYDESLHQRIEKTLFIVLDNIGDEFKELLYLNSPLDYVQSSFLKNKMLPDINLMSLIVERYEFLERGWQTLMLTKMQSDRKRAIINGGIVGVGIVTSIFAGKIVGLFGLVPESTFVFARGVALFGDILFTQYFCRMALDYYIDYRQAERRANTSVVDEGLVNLAEVKELRVRFYGAAIFASISFGLSAFEVARLVRNPAFGVIIRGEVKPALKNVGHGALRSLRGDKLISTTPTRILDQYGNTYVRVVATSEKVGYYLVKPISFLKAKGWGFLKTLRVEVPKGAIYGATGALLGYFFYERLNASAFAVVTFTKGLLGIKPNTREISSSMRDTTKIIRQQTHEGIYDVNGTIFQIRDWENRKDLIIIKLHLGIISENDYNNELTEIDDQIRVRLYDLGRRYHDFPEHRHGMQNQLRKFNIELSLISDSQYSLSYHGLTVIYDAASDKSSMSDDSLNLPYTK